MKAYTMKSTVRNTVMTLALAFALMGATAATAMNDAGVAGTYLRYGSSARSLALGNAVTGIADDAAIAYWNPAGLAQLRTMELTGMGATMYGDTRYSYLALGMPTERWGTFSVSGTFTSSGEFERATWDADLSETFSEQEGIVTLGWGTSWNVHRLADLLDRGDAAEESFDLLPRRFDGSDERTAWFASRGSQLGIGLDIGSQFFKQAYERGAGRAVFPPFLQFVQHGHEVG